MPTLTINRLYVSIDDKEILKGVDLKIEQGQTHALMGPNGGGKSTLANALAKHPKYKITSGTVRFGKKRIDSLSADGIAKAGILMAFQYPQSVSGVSVSHLLKLAMLKNVPPGKKNALGDFTSSLKASAKRLQLTGEFLTRSLNEGFSGGEKKKAEILQLAMLAPKLVILDETDSGLDVDALKLVASEINRLQKNGISVLIITHYQRILKYIQPDFVHVMREGRIVKSGGKELAREIEEKGYGKLSKMTNVKAQTPTQFPS